MTDCRMFGRMPDYDEQPGEQPRIIGLLSWYDEHPEWLVELVESMAAAGVDHVVAVDGAYAAYPGAKANSGAEQAQAIVAACCRVSLGCSMYVPQVAWGGNELQKRTFLFAAGHLVAQPGVDWFWVLDGDEVITHHQGLKDALAATDRQVATVNLWEGPPEGTHQFNSQSLRMLFCAQRSGITVEGHHAHYRTGDGEVLWNSCQPVNELPTERLEHVVRVRHRASERAPDRTQDRLGYYDRARDLKLERLG